MNGIRAQEILEILDSLGVQSPEGQAAVLATAVSLDGSVYARSGAMAVIVPGVASRPGMIAFSELDGFLPAEAEAASEAGRPRLIELEIAEDDPLPSLGLGAPGKLEVFLEPVNSSLREHLHGLRNALLKGDGVVSGVEIAGPDLGRRVLYRPEDAAVRDCYREMSPELDERASHGIVRRTFLCPVHPMGKVLIFGSGRDASLLAAQLHELGFTVYVGDPRRGRLRGEGWDAKRFGLIEGGWEQMRVSARPDADSSIVVMTHSYALDLETLQGALASPAAYVGLIGPQKRTAKLLRELEMLEVKPRLGQLFAPPGLDIGAEAPHELALAIAAEILAVRSGRKGGRASSKRPPHAASPQRPKTPGMILAAGSGKRFSGGNKLTQMFEGKPVLRHVVENALASRLDPVIVVLGCQAEDSLKALAGLHDSRLRVVYNPLWEGGKASSIEVGLREVPFGTAGVVSLLGDMPLVKTWLIDRVVSEFELSGQLTFPIFAAPDGPKKGYPTAFPRELFGEIRALTGDDTAMDAVRAHWGEAVKIPLRDDWTQADIDTPEDMQLLPKTSFFPVDD